MLSRDGVIARFIFGFCLYFLSGTGMVTGNIAAISGVVGTILLTSALLHYSPLVELWANKVNNKRGNDL